MPFLLDPVDSTLRTAKDFSALDVGSRRSYDPSAYAFQYTSWSHARMMPPYKDADYGTLTIKKWLELADTGALSLPIFQRSHVWRPWTVAAYVKALLENRPTGVLLLLPSHNGSEFDSRTIHGAKKNSTVKTYLLDGQQRLRSLWDALNGRGRPFYIEVKDIQTLKLGVQAVKYPSSQLGVAAKHRVPANAYGDNLIPVATLGAEACVGNERAIWDWCHEALGDPNAAKDLEVAIKKKLLRPFLERKLAYCELNSRTPSAVAIDIFVEANQSSYKVQPFDIVVAQAEKKHQQQFRTQVQTLRDRCAHLEYYFSPDKEAYVPGIGEWCLKVMCLLAENPVRRTGYEKAFDLFVAADANGNFGQLGEYLDGALEFAAVHGAATRKTLPSWPAIHVIAALQERLKGVSSVRARPARFLLKRYLWRSWLTDRYWQDANGRLFEDLPKIGGCLDLIAEGKPYAQSEALVPVFTSALPSARDLSSLQWIGRSRLGKAVAAAVASSGAREWFTGRALDHTRIRKLDTTGRLDRHHVFPKSTLEHLPKEFLEAYPVNHGLNGVWLPKDENQSLGKKDPRVYVQEMVKRTDGLSESKARRNIESHFVPYDIMMADEPVEVRYPRFLEARAGMIEELLADLTGDSEDRT